MEPLSRNKKIGILSLVVLSLTLLGLFWTGKMSFSWLKSDILNQSEYICTEKGQITNKGAYTRALKSRDNTNNLINLRQSEITVLENKITTNQTLMTQKKSQIETKKSTIKDLQVSINKNCVWNLKPNAQKICNQKKQQLQKVQSDAAALAKEISSLESEIKKFEQQIATKKQNIKVLEAKRDVDILFITQYELCDRQLKVKPLLTSPKMSGEARMSGEFLVSWEICMSSEVLISGEVHMSGEINAPVYRLAVTEEYPGKAEIESIDYDFATINADTLQVSDWFVAEEHTPNMLYRCSFQDTNKTQLRCIPDTKVSVQSETRNYILYARVKAITGAGSFKVYGANITYNGGKIDAVNRTTPIKIRYGEKRACHNEKPSITVISPNGGETLNLSDAFTISWKVPESQAYNTLEMYLVPQDNTPRNPIDPWWYNIGWRSLSRSLPSSYPQVLISSPGSLNGVPNGTYKLRIFMFPEGPIKIWNMNTAIASDESDSYFKVVSATIKPFELLTPATVRANEAFDVTVKALKSDGNINTAYEGSIFFSVNPRNMWSIYPHNIDQYWAAPFKFSLSDNGQHTFSKSFIFPKAWVYEITITDNLTFNEVTKMINVVSSPLNGQCSTNVNSCIVGILQDTPDTNTVYTWTCLGINGGTNAACSKPIIDTIPPVITSLTLPTTYSTTRVPLTITANESPVSYLMIDGPTPANGLVPALPPKPAANDIRWLSVKPTSYNFTGISSRTLFAWVKDIAGNVSEYRSAVVTINQCPEIMPPVCNENEELVPQTGTGQNGCPLPPVCKPKQVAGCIDSDGGKDAFKFGTITLNWVVGKSDTCSIDGKTVTEYSCLDTQTYGGSVEISCSNGCQKGACISDSDIALCNLFPNLCPIQNNQNPAPSCTVYPPLPENWCRGTILTLPKDKNGCELPPVCIL